MRTTIGVLFGVAAVLVAGCGTVSGEAQPESATASDPTFDPCDDIPDEVILDLGMDPATETRDILGVHQPGWHICEWRNQAYSVAVMSTNYGLDDLRNQTEKYGRFDTVMWGGREGLRFHGAAADQTECNFATATADGMAWLTVMVEGSPEDSCVLMEKAALPLLAHVPD